MLFIPLLNSTLLDEKSVPRLFVWDRSNALISSTFSNKDRNGKGRGLLCGQDDGKADQIQVWGKLPDREEMNCGRGDGRGQQRSRKGRGQIFCHFSPPI